MVSDARKVPWYLDLTPSEMEAVIAAVPALLGVATLMPAVVAWNEGAMPLLPMPAIRRALIALDAQHPGWRTWLTVEHHGR
jgi:hypothetical protein